MASKALSSATTFVAISTIFLFASPSAHSAFGDDGKGVNKFTYVGSTGPEYWSRLSPKNSLCSQGKQQSPVNILKKQTVFNKNLKPLTRDYKAADATLFHHGYQLELEFEAGMLVVDGKNYSLKQMHWHTPSEHRINGIQYPAELHLVHKADDGNIAVVGILYKIGKPDSFVSRLQGAFKALRNDDIGIYRDGSHMSCGKMIFAQIKRNVHKYYRYIGSLTTPPCTENIVWNVLAKARSISPEQVLALKAPLRPEYKENSRPVQPLNGRRVEIPF